MINWEREPARTERGIQALLRNLYPGLRSLDGAGGDGGRDAQLVTADGRTVFEVKSFGRLTASRRRQVETSLRQAVKSAPDMSRWVLVIPMNMTPVRPGGRSSEEAWFDERLPELAPGVDLSWWGQDWLDGQIAENMNIQRYIEGVDGQLLQRAREFEMEKAVLADGVDGLHSRLGGLRRRVDEISPYWTLDFADRNGVREAILRAKIPDAPTLDPITFTTTFSFPTDDAEDRKLRSQFERTLDFGGSVDLPAGYVTQFDVDASPEARLLLPDRDPANSEFTFFTAREHLERPVRCNYQVLNGEGAVLAQFPVYIRERTAGTRGATLYGGDAADIAKFEVGIPRPPETSQPGESLTMSGASLEFDLPNSLVGYDVDSLLPVYRVLAAATEGTQLRFELPGLGYLGGETLDTAPFAAAQAIHQLIEDLQRMQQLTGSVLSFPADVTNGEVKDLRNAVRRLDGEPVAHEGGLILNLRPEAVGDFLLTVKSAPDGAAGGLLMASENLDLKVGDLTLPYGASAFWAPHPRLANQAELEELAARGARDAYEVQARFEPTEHEFRWLPRQQAEAYFESGERPGESELASSG